MSEEFENTFSDNEKRKALRIRLESEAVLVRHQAEAVTSLEGELREELEALLQRMVTVSALEVALEAMALEAINKEEKHV